MLNLNINSSFTFNIQLNFNYPNHYCTNYLLYKIEIDVSER